MESITLIDVSSENDLLISSPSQGLSTNIEGPGYSNSGSDKLNAISNAREMSEEKLQVPELSASPKQKRGSSKCNLRKSLAWDNAFFTNEGVLNHEELAIVNGTFKKAEADKLPSIQEDSRNSMDSSTTLDSDVWELDNLEVDLFENLRASIQRSVGKLGKASSVLPSTKPTHLGRLATSQHQSSNMAEISSRLKMKPPTACKRIVNSKQAAANTTKVTLCPMQVVTAGKKDLKPSIRPPRSASRATTVPNTTQQEGFYICSHTNGK
ncbi:hypothetical protein IHE45_12G074100 [Dioscorea alata]|uniref:Uncharacterized protein n=1 Tax=Dioscorea alata TaxID=55571 RepID=A0ACB7V371_DIOAL|nr:hypothetical protein IHE45_12G074100 [Dioscorea alata]